MICELLYYHDPKRKSSAGLVKLAKNSARSTQVLATCGSGSSFKGTTDEITICHNLYNYDAKVKQDCLVLY